MKRTFIVLCAVALVGCADATRDYDASADCMARGYDAGTPAYGNCIKQIRTERLMEQNRKELEQRRMDEQYERSYRGMGRPY